MNLTKKIKEIRKEALTNLNPIEDYALVIYLIGNLDPFRPTTSPVFPIRFSTWI